MKRIMNSVFLLVFLMIGLIFLSPKSFAAESNIAVNVVVVDTTGDEVFPLSIPFGMIIDVMNIENASEDPLQFVIVNGKVVDELIVLASGSLNIIAVFGEVDVYIDSNGAYLGDGASAEPNKPGYIFDGFDEGTEFGLATLYRAQYELATEDQVEIIINGDSVLKAYNEVVTVTSIDPEFSYWADENGVVLTYKRDFKFTALVSREIVEVIDESSVQKSLVYMVNATSIREDFTSLYGQIELTEGDVLVEFGFIATESLGLFNIDTEGVTVIPSKSMNAHGEFLRSLVLDDFVNFRAYAKIQQGEAFITIYSDLLNITPNHLSISVDNELPEIYAGSNIYDYELELLDAISITGIQTDGSTYEVADIDFIADLTNTGTVRVTVLDHDNPSIVGTFEIEVIGQFGAVNSILGVNGEWDEIYDPENSENNLLQLTSGNNATKMNTTYLTENGSTKQYVEFMINYTDYGLSTDTSTPRRLGLTIRTSDGKGYAFFIYPGFGNPPTAYDIGWGKIPSASTTNGTLWPNTGYMTNRYYLGSTNTFTGDNFIKLAVLRDESSVKFYVNDTLVYTNPETSIVGIEDITYVGVETLLALVKVKDVLVIDGVQDVATFNDKESELLTSSVYSATMVNGGWNETFTENDQPNNGFRIDSTSTTAMSTLYFEETGSTKEYVEYYLNYQTHHVVNARFGITIKTATGKGYALFFFPGATLASPANNYGWAKNTTNTANGAAWASAGFIQQGVAGLFESLSGTNYIKLAILRDGTSIKFYMNDVLVYTNPETTLIGAEDVAYIGVEALKAAYVKIKDIYIVDGNIDVAAFEAKVDELNDLNN